ncbi:MAG: PAS domain S-box protein [Kiritimatiellia bacterium]
MDAENTGDRNGQPPRGPAPDLTPPPDANSRLEAILQALPDLLFVIDREGRIYDYHSAADDQLYLPAERFLGRKVADVIPEPAAGLILGALKTAAERGRRQCVVYPLPYPEGVRWFEASIAVQGDPRAPDGRLVFLARDVTERKQTEDALKTSETRYRELIDFAVDGILLGSPDGLITEANARMCALAGRTRADLVGKHVRELFDPDALDGTPLRFDQLRQGETVTSERRIRRPDASEVLVEMHTKMMPDGTYQSIYHDVTGRKRAEEALRESEQTYRMLTEGMKDVLWVLDVEAQRFTYVSPSVEALRGYTAEEVLAQPLAEAWVPEEREKLLALMQGYVADFFAGKIDENTYVPIEFLQPCKDGSTVWSEAVCHLQRNARTGRLELHGVTRDITRRMQAENAFRESETRFNNVAQTSRSYAWEIDADGLLTYVSPVVADVLGYRPEEIAGKMHFWDFYPPEAAETAKAASLQIFRAARPVAGFENPNRTKDGRLVWISSSATPLFRADGSLRGYQGVDIDVTARKQAEEALRESETRFDQSAQQSRTYLWEVDAEGRYTFASHVVADVLGYRPEEIVGHLHYYDLFPEETRAALRAEIAAAIQDRRSFRDYENRCRAKDGRDVWVITSAIPLLNPDGSLRGYRGSDTDISERKRAERSLRESEARFAQTARQSRAFVWEVDAEGRYMFVTPVVEDVLGYRPDEIAGRVHFYDLHPAESREAFKAAAFAVVRRHGEFRDFENPMVAKDGRAIWVSTNAFPLLDKDGALLGYRGVDLDVTERKRAQDALRESEARVRAVQDNLPDGLVYQIDSGPDGQQRRFTFLSQGVERLHGVAAEDALQDPMAIYGQVLPDDLRGVAEQEAQAAAALTPLRVEVRVRLPSGEIRWRRFTSAPRRLPNGHLVWDGIEVDVTERKLAEDALRESEARFATATQASRSYVWEVAPDGLYTHVGDMVAEVLGYRPEDLVGRMHFYDLLPPEGREELKQACFEIMARRESSSGFENVNVAKDGRLVWVSSSARPLFNADGSYRGYQGIDTDVSARKQAEDALRESELRLRTLNDNLPGGLVYQMDTGVDGRERRLLAVSKGVERMHGVTVEEALSHQKTFYLQIVPEDQARVAELEARAIATLTPFRAEVRCRMPTGEIRWIYVSSAPHRLPNGHVVWDGIELDVTERKLAEEALRQSEAKYRYLHETMRDAFASADMKGRIQDFNPAFRELLGYSDEELRKLDYRKITPRKWHAAEARILREQVLPRGYSDVYEKEYVRQDGSVVPIELRTILIRDESGQATGMWASIRDVSERKRAEEALRRSESKYRLLFENMLDAYAAMDLRGRLIDCNPAFEKLVGYTREELLRLHLADVTPREWMAVEKKAIAQMRRRGYSKRFEKEYVRRDGSRVPVELQGSLLRDDRGRPAGFWAIIRDVADRKRAADALRQAHDELERRVRERTAELETSREALAQSEEQFRQMAENVQDAFWLIDARTLQALYVSPAFKRIWNWPVENDVVRWFAHIHPEDRDRIVRAFQSGMKTGIPGTVTYRLVWPDGSIRWIESSGSMIRDARGRPVRAAGLHRDVTERRRMEAEILQAAEAERQRIGRDLHDSLGQSLTAIGYLADAVREDLARAKRPEAADVRKLGRLIEKTADQSHALARGLLLADLKRGGLGAALQELAFRTQELFGGACRYAGPANLPPVDANTAGQLYRIAQEAVTNAAKHGQALRIDVRLAQNKKGLRLSVRDTGKGFSAGKRKRAGLGLDIMRYRAGLIGATLEIDSQPNRGTTVLCLLPLAAPASPRKK